MWKRYVSIKCVRNVCFAYHRQSLHPFNGLCLHVLLLPSPLPQEHACTCIPPLPPTHTRTLYTPTFIVCAHTLTPTCVLHIPHVPGPSPQPRLDRGALLHCPGAIPYCSGHERQSMDPWDWGAGWVGDSRVSRTTWSRPLTHFIRLMQAMYDALMCLVKEQRVRCVGGYTIQL